jgi:hypothetical protein
LSQFEVPKLIRTIPVFRPAPLISSAGFTYTCSEFLVNANFAKFRLPRPPSRPTYWVGPQRLAIFRKRATGFSELLPILFILTRRHEGLSLLHLFRPAAVKIDYEGQNDHEHDFRGLFTGLEPAEGFGRGKANLVKNTMNNGISELL